MTALTSDNKLFNSSLSVTILLVNIYSNIFKNEYLNLDINFFVNIYFEKLGYTSHHPRGSFALKTRQAGVVTRLLDVEWNVGKSGAVSPVAILEPCIIGEATVSRATLHNTRYIEDLNLEIGCLVEVIRSGEIIPRILSRAD